jgi:hypothetical protein
MKVIKPTPSKKQSKAMFEMSSVAKSFIPDDSYLQSPTPPKPPNNPDDSVSV